MKWIRNRLLEASTWAGVSAGFTFYYLWSILPPSLHNHVVLPIAISSALMAVFLEEGKG